jgi:carbon storage regulator
MLILTRRVDEILHIGRDVTVTVTRIRGRQVSLGIDAPPNVNIWRDELEEGEDGEPSDGVDARARRCERP